MKNVRMYEDGNRIIIVLEGYEKNAVSLLTEALRATMNPLEHITPHNSESSFQLKGTEKELPLQKKDTGEPQIKKPAFVEEMESKTPVEAAEPAYVKQENSDPLTEKSQFDGQSDTVSDTNNSELRPKDVDLMNTVELHQFIRNADQHKLQEVICRKGRYPNVKWLLNADEKTIREYAKLI